MTFELCFKLPNSSDWISLSSDDQSEETKAKLKLSKEKLNQQLLTALQMQNIMVLAGSGTSLGDTNGPSMHDLWNLCMKENNSYTKLATKIANKIGFNIQDDNQVNIEAFLSLCESHIQIANDQEISSFVNHCKKVILSACAFDKDENSLSGHRTFIHRLSRRRTRDSRLKIFTTNYDTCFEEAASLQGIVIVDGFSFSKPRRYDARFFDFDIVRRGPVSTGVDSYLEGVFQLYKLHGSVNWSKKEDEIIEAVASAENACMIFPAQGKYQQSYIQPHLELMARFLGSLREPNTCLIVSGFGFNDDHLSEPIISAIKTNPYLKIIVVDCCVKDKLNSFPSPNKDYWQKLKELSENGEDILFVNSTFKLFAELIPDLKSLTPAEKVSKAIKSLVGDQV